MRYTPRPAVAKKLDPYCAIIQSRLEELPRLSAKRSFDEIRAAGYAGGYTQLKEHVRRVRPAAPPELLIRFETAAGHQAQMDFASFTLPWGRRYALLVVLGYSRLLWMHFYARQTMQTLFRGPEAAFGFFGGVPAESRECVLQIVDFSISGQLSTYELDRLSSSRPLTEDDCL